MVALDVKQRWAAAGWRRRTALLVAVLLLFALIGSYVAARRDGDESAIERLPSDAAISQAWPAAVVLGRNPDSVHRLYEQESMILSLQLAKNSTLTITARDYGGPFRAWLVAKAFSPSWNGYYWDYPERRPVDGSGKLPRGSRLVGFECFDGVGIVGSEVVGSEGTPSCGRWVLWWKRGRGIWKVHWSGPAPATTAEAITVLSPLCRGN